MIPDLPMPVRMTRPLQWRSSWTAASNRSSRRPISARIAAASVSSTFFASDRSAMQGPLGLFDDGVDRGQAPQQRFERVEPQRVLRVALRARGLFVDFEKDAVHPRR